VWGGSLRARLLAGDTAGKAHSAGRVLAWWICVREVIQKWDGNGIIAIFVDLNIMPGAAWSERTATNSDRLAKNSNKEQQTATT
jgi:hypothetical protein